MDLIHKVNQFLPQARRGVIVHGTGCVVLKLRCKLSDWQDRFLGMDIIIAEVQTGFNRLIFVLSFEAKFPPERRLPLFNPSFFEDGPYG